MQLLLRLVQSPDRPVQSPAGAVAEVAVKVGAVAVKVGAVADHFALISAINFNVTLCSDKVSL